MGAGKGTSAYKVWLLVRILVLLLVQGSLANGQVADLLFLATGKLQGLFTPLTSSGAVCDPDESDDCYGGHARRLAYYEAKKEELAGTNTTLIMVNLGGDTFGGPFYTHPDYDIGYPAMTLSNMMPFDVCTFSTRDFLCKGDTESLAQNIESHLQRTCPLVISNGEFSESFEGLNQRRKNYIVKEFDNGVKVGFFGLFQRVEGLTGSYDPSVVNLDPNSRHGEILNGTLYEMAINVSAYKAALKESKDSPSQMSDYLGDVYRLATEVPIDVLMAASEAQAEHPDILAMVLVVGTSDRQDQLDWLQLYGPFDIFLVSDTNPDDSDYKEETSLSSKRVLSVHVHGHYGFTALRAQVSKGSGVQSFEYTASLALNSSIPSDATVQTQLSEYYQYIRDRNAQPFGSVTNPILGGHRVDEAYPSKHMCYYMDCPAGSILGKAFLRHAFLQGFEADLALYNLGGFRAVLAGDDEGQISMSHCTRTFQFQNALKIYTILGKDLYNGVKNMMLDGERGFIGGGIRVAFHEPCWSFVDHTTFSSHSDDLMTPGSYQEVNNCTAAGISPDIEVIDVEVYVRNEELCVADTPCEERVWETLEKGRQYTLVSSEYLSTIISGFVETSISLSKDDEAVCEYIAAMGVVEVESWSAYRDRGVKQYATATEGWAAGNRVPSVVAQASKIEDAADCPDGKWLPERGTECVACGVGTRSLEDSSACVNCEAGFYGDVEGLASCKLCPSGRYAESSGATVCEACPVGSYSELAASSCFSCRPGLYNDQEEASYCTVCPLGTFSNASGAASCRSCGDGFITTAVSATDEEDCVCPSGSYRNGAGECEACPEGLGCEVASDVLNIINGSGARPLALPGFMTRVEEPLKAWKCIEADCCPGGYPSTCEDGRDSSSIACGLCQEDMYDAGLKCLPCDGWSTPGILAGIAAALALLVAVSLVTSVDLHKRSRIGSFILTAVGVALMATQTISILNDLTVKWVEPLATMFSFAALLTVDFKVVRTQCWFGQEPIIKFGFRQFCPLLAAPIVSLVILTKSKIGRPVRVGIESCNVFGAVLNALYIGLLKSCLSPFICYQHPLDHGASMIEFPSVLCWQTSGTSLTLSILSIAGFLCIPLPFTAFVLYGSLKHKALLSDHSPAGLTRLHVTRFMWFRFSNECYYYGLVLLLRNFLLCIVPIFAAYDPVIQIGCMFFIILFFLQLQSYLQPWRTLEANLFDSAISATLLAALVSAAMASELQADAYRSSFLVVAALVVGFSLALSAGGMCFGAYQLLQAHRFKYDYFLCHHKLHAGAQCRLLKVLLQNKGKQVFIDSDDLRDLDTLFDTVKFCVNHLLVYLTGETLTRPWCAGEIFSALRCSVPLIVVRTPAFREPSFDALRKVDRMLDESACSLSDYKISHADIAEAYRTLLGPEIMSINLDPEMLASRRLPRLILDLLARNQVSQKDSGATNMASLRHEDGLLVFSCDQDDDEAVAAAEILLSLMMPMVRNADRHVCRLFDYKPDEQLQHEIVVKASGSVVLLSRDSLRNRSQLLVVVDAMRSKLDGSGEVVPVTTPGFQFPVGGLLQAFQAHTLPIELGDADRNLLRGLFKLIAVSFPTHASEDVLKVQAQEVYNRILLNTAASKKQSNPRAPERFEDGEPDVGPSEGDQETTTNFDDEDAVHEV